MYLKASSVVEIEDFYMLLYIYYALNYWDRLNQISVDLHTGLVAELHVSDPSEKLIPSVGINIKL